MNVNLVNSEGYKPFLWAVPLLTMAGILVFAFYPTESAPGSSKHVIILVALRTTGSEFPLSKFESYLSDPKVIQPGANVTAFDLFSEHSQFPIFDDECPRENNNPDFDKKERNKFFYTSFRAMGKSAPNPGLFQALKLCVHSDGEELPLRLMTFISNHQRDLSQGHTQLCIISDFLDIDILASIQHRAANTILQNNSIPLPHLDSVSLWQIETSHSDGEPVRDFWNNYFAITGSAPTWQEFNLTTGKTKPAYTTILLDRSEPVTMDSLLAVKEFVKNSITEESEGEIFVLDGESKEFVAPIAKFNGTAFLATWDHVRSALLPESTQAPTNMDSNSPIMEYVHDISEIEPFSPHKLLQKHPLTWRQYPRRLIIVSDMRQNSILSHISDGDWDVGRNPREFSAVKEDEQYSGTFHADLTDVEVCIFQLPRRQTDKKSVRRFWDSYFRDCGTSPEWHNSTPTH